MKRRKNGFRIMLKDKPLGQESWLKMQKQRVSRSRKIRGKLKTWN